MISSLFGQTGLGNSPYPDQSDQGLHSLLFSYMYWTKYPKALPLFLNFR